MALHEERPILRALLIPEVASRLEREAEITGPELTLLVKCVEALTKELRFRVPLARSADDLEARVLSILLDGGTEDDMDIALRTELKEVLLHRCGPGSYGLSALVSGVGDMRGRLVIPLDLVEAEEPARGRVHWTFPQAYLLYPHQLTPAKGCAGVTSVFGGRGLMQKFEAILVSEEN